MQHTAVFSHILYTTHLFLISCVVFQVISVDNFLTPAECEAMIGQSDQGEGGVYSTTDASTLEAVKVR